MRVFELEEGVVATLGFCSGLITGLGSVLTGIIGSGLLIGFGSVLTGIVGSGLVIGFGSIFISAVEKVTTKLSNSR
ncbi:MAG: hypothetical protein EU532_07850 [Promethearchaeota archaeon]|nr:MAG: hypothetical protein EU532_07850 [Candidatus Lokiarchaeota archaeon]